MCAYIFDNQSLIRNGTRWFPLMGEIHYSRYPKEFWKESLCKMKAGGIDIVSSYVIWIHHEEIEGQYDFTGCRDLRAFVQSCKECNIKLLLRIGPWSHGEVRNGGFPDWLLQKDFKVRTNDKKYLSTVKKWYKEIYNQVKGYCCSPKDTENTIIGVQIENEFGHCGGLYDESGDVHMKKLQKIAKQAGFKVPLYTATGWGGARTGGMLPVMGGYCDAPWDQRTTKIEPSGNYIFTYERNDHNIGSDHGLGYGITFDQSKFPYLTAELGGGLQVTAHRRTVAKASDIGAMSLVKMGSGCNLLGYYMYHGGTNPYGKLTTLQETKATGYPNDLPELSYDFRAPVREYGQISETFREIKLLSYFVHSYGDEFCEMKAQIPSDNPLKVDNMENLRYSFRCKDNKGYLFVNNYVRLEKLASHKNQVIKTPDGTVTFPEMNIEDQDYFFLPYNITYGNTKVETALVTPFFKTQDNTFVFYSRRNLKKIKNAFKFTGELKDRFLVLSREDALNTWKTSDGNIFITDSDSYIIEDEKGNINFYSNSSENKICFYSYMELHNDSKGFKKIGMEDKNICEETESFPFIKYELENSIKNGSINIPSSINENKFSLNLSEVYKTFISNKDINSYDDCFISIDYTGESAKLYAVEDGKKHLIADNFYLGEDYKWEIGLKRFISRNIDFSTLELEIKPLVHTDSIFLEKWPVLLKEGKASLNKVDYRCELKIIL